MLLNKVTKVPDGSLYDANFDERILTLRAKAKRQCFAFNQCFEPAEQQDILRTLLQRVGRHCVIEPPFYCDYGSNIEIGDNFYANHNLIILDGAPVIIGNHVYIAPNVGLYTAGHPIDVNRRNARLEFVKPICIGDNVWIGAGCMILPGVTIGANSVIGAGSVVTRDIPDSVVALGNPCQVIRPVSEADGQRQQF